MGIQADHAACCNNDFMRKRIQTALPSYCNFMQALQDCFPFDIYTHPIIDGFIGQIVILRPTSPQVGEAFCSSYCQDFRLSF